MIDQELHFLENSPDPQDQIQYLTLLLRIGRLELVDITTLAVCDYLPAQAWLFQNQDDSLGKWTLTELQKHLASSTSNCRRDVFKNDDEFILFVDARRDPNLRQVAPYESIVPEVLRTLPGLSEFIDFFCYFAHCDDICPNWKDAMHIKMRGGRCGLLALASYFFTILKEEEAPQHWVDHTEKLINLFRDDNIANLRLALERLTPPWDGERVDQALYQGWQQRTGIIGAQRLRWSDPTRQALTAYYVRMPLIRNLLMKTLSYVARRPAHSVGNPDFFLEMINGYLRMLYTLENPNLINWPEALNYMKQFIIQGLLHEGLGDCKCPFQYEP